MKKLVAILSSLLFMFGLKAQTPVTVRKETTPQVKPPRPPLDSATTNPVKDLHIKQTTGTFKKGAVNDSLVIKGMKDATIKQSVPVKNDKTIKFDKNQLPMKEVPIKK